MNPLRPKLVFCGPTLQPEDRPAEAGLVFLPPALQGSFLHAVKRYEPQAILLIDGGFQSAPAVRHKEILWAIGRGIPVLGAASMGALRAAELAPHMQGYGLIYRWYRRFPLTPDDAVAVLHGPAEVGFAPLTDSLVDLRRTFRHALRARNVSADMCRRLADAARRLNFRDRRLDRVISEAVTGKTCSTLHKALSRSFVQQKRRDALAALEVLRAGTYSQSLKFDELPLTRIFASELEAAGWLQP